MRRTFAFITLSLTTTGLCAWADVIDISASDRGWVCTEIADSICPGNNGADPENNYFAGTNFDNSKFRDWFEFAVPTLAGESIVSATLNLDEYSTGFFPGVSYTYSVYGLGAQPIVFADVSASQPFGSVVTSGGFESSLVSITLNGAALAAIGADEGGFIFIGGIDSAELGPPGEILGTPFGVGDFGNTGAPGSYNTVLSISTAPALSGVPEPNMSVLLVIGAVLLVRSRRLAIR